ncbi:ATP-NAD kinase-like domain-containing protein [Ampelomyces quisqualis]|uniref:ATP-NAD kinase-like domain-containing protein n=1 Tax=Ampelomyces quisqualis TaxID=50730 RepID=A0A6A5R0Y2_AMPQU|nr:ATP-NAD kinase-like domain-containing protein [Ampelomyces quisqualis]
MDICVDRATDSDSAEINVTMAEKEVKSTEQPQAPKEFTIKLPSLYGQFDIVAQLQENEEDAAHPPRLLNISKMLRDDPLPAASSRETHIILSTGSGHQKANSFYSDVLSPIFEATGITSTNLHTTKSESSILDLTRDIFFPAANSAIPLRIILASGDGGMVDLINGLLALPHSPSYIPPDIVLLPLGTANALYHSTHPGANTWGLSALTSRTSKPLPTYTATFSPGSRLLVDEARSSLDFGQALHGAVVVSWGMHASLVADSDSATYRQHGIARFKMAAQEALYPSDASLPHAYRGSVSVLRSSSEHPTWVEIHDTVHLYVLATLVSHLERTFCISPSSAPLGGDMYLVHFGPTTGDDAMRIMGLAYQAGKHVDDENVRYEKIEGIRIAMHEADERWRRVCVDGKIVRVEEGGWVEVRKRERGVVNLVLGELSTSAQTF